MNNSIFDLKQKFTPLSICVSLYPLEGGNLGITTTSGEGWFIVIVHSPLSSSRIHTYASSTRSSQVDSHPRTVLALCYFTLVIKWEIVFPTCALANCRFLMKNIFPHGTPVFQSADTTRICNTTWTNYNKERGRT